MLALDNNSMLITLQSVLEIGNRHRLDLNTPSSVPPGSTGMVRRSPLSKSLQIPMLASALDIWKLRSETSLRRSSRQQHWTHRIIVVFLSDRITAATIVEPERDGY